MTSSTWTSYTCQNVFVLQTDINTSMRAILIDWMFEVCKEFKFPASYIHRAIKFFDISLEYTQINRNEIQALGCACLSLIDLFFSGYAHDVDDWTYISDHSFTSKKFLNLQIEVFKYLGYNVFIKTYYDELQEKLQDKLAGHNESVKRYALFLAGYLLHYYTVALENARDVADDIIKIAMNIKSIKCEPVIRCLGDLLSSTKTPIGTKIKYILKSESTTLGEWKTYTTFTLNSTATLPMSGKIPLTAFKTHETFKIIDGDDLFTSTSLGSGVYGRVNTCKYKDETLASKRFFDESLTGSTVREIVVSNSFSHPHILSFKYLTIKDERIYMVMDIGNQSLRKWIGNANYSSADITRTTLGFIDHLILGLSEFHSKGFVHRDIKPDNIILFTCPDDQPMKAKLADFGCSIHTDIYNDRKTCDYDMCTLWYRPPELLLGGNCTEQKIDIWSLGCVIAEMLTREPLLPGDSSIDQLFKIFKMFGTPSDTTWPGINVLPNWKTTFPKWKNSDDFEHQIDGSLIKLSKKRKTILTSMFECDPSKRPSIYFIKEQWFSESGEV